MTAIRAILHQTSITLVTTLVIQITSFALLALAPLVLPIETFAQLVVIVAVTMLANGFFELGLNLSSTKFHSDSGKDGPFLTAFRVRLACIPIGIALWALTWGCNFATEIGAGLFCGAVLNLWNGVRATDQARQDYRSFAKSSLLFAALRLGFGGSVLLLTQDPVLTGLAIYVLPVVAGTISDSWPLVTGAFRRNAPPPGPMLRYALFVYLNALVFIGLPYLPQILISQRLDATATGTYGLILTYTAPVSLLTFSLRSVLLPKMLNSDIGLETALWSVRGAVAVSGIAVLSCLGGVLISLLLDRLYGGRFLGIQESFAIYFAGFAVTATIGIYSLSVHTLGAPQVAIASTLAKIIILGALLFPLGTSLIRVVSITSATMVVGELILISLLARTRIKANPQ